MKTLTTLASILSGEKDTPNIEASFIDTTSHIHVIFTTENTGTSEQMLMEIFNFQMDEQALFSSFEKYSDN